MFETVVLCGGASRARDRRSAVTLALSGADANIRLRMEDISTRMVAHVPDVLADLLEVATYIYCADQLVSRGGASMHALGTNWRRSLRVVIPVRTPDLWASPDVKASLERVLSFMAEDQLRLEFVRATNPPSIGSYLRFDSSAAAHETPDEVVLFSGGLDSLAGAAERLAHGDARLLLVGHQSSTKLAERQRHLARELAGRFPGRVLHVPVRITKRGLRAVENTQRTRSFLYAALAAVVARLAHRSRVSFFENGIVSFNLPIAEQVVGARATRSTHPRVVKGLTEFLSALLGSEMTIDHPFLWKTKTEVAAILRQSGHADLARHSVSCSSIHGMTTLWTHCGCCSQCLDRRFAMLAAGMREEDPAEMYEVDLLIGARGDGRDRTMAESFVRHALEIQRLTDVAFVGRFGGHIARAASSISGMTVDQVVMAALDLHRRHAGAVSRVLTDAIGSSAKDLAEQRLPESCLLRIIAGGGVGLGEVPIRDPTEIEPGPALHGEATFPLSEICLAVDDRSKEVRIRAIPPLRGPATFALFDLLVEAHKRDRADGKSPENYAFLRGGQLSKSLGIAEGTLRRRVLRVRKKIATSFLTHAGLPLRNDAVIESERWHGYRINPAVRVVALDQL